MMMKEWNTFLRNNAELKSLEKRVFKNTSTFNTKGLKVLKLKTQRRLKRLKVKLQRQLKRPKPKKLKKLKNVKYPSVTSGMMRNPLLDLSFICKQR